MAFIYRDSETGRFVSESTYNRSVSHGGDRYEKEDTSDWGTESGEEVDFSTLDQLEEYLEDYTWDELMDFDEVEYESSADYGLGEE